MKEEISFNVIIRIRCKNHEFMPTFSFVNLLQKPSQKQRAFILRCQFCCYHSIDSAILEDFQKYKICLIFSVLSAQNKAQLFQRVFARASDQSLVSWASPETGVVYKELENWTTQTQDEDQEKATTYVKLIHLSFSQLKFFKIPVNLRNDYWRKRASLRSAG